MSIGHKIQVIKLGLNPIAKVAVGPYRICGFVFILCILLGLNPVRAEAEKALIIFADFACTDNAVGDPDDCLAVEALRRSGEVDILAVMAGGGNSNANVSYQLAQQKFPDLTVLSGTKPGTQRVTSAHQHLFEMLRQHSKPVTALVLSPATDFNLFIQEFPQSLSRIEEVIFVAGRSPNDVFAVGLVGKVVRDMNYEEDRTAFAQALPALFEARVPVQFIGFRASMKTPVPREFAPQGFADDPIQSWRRKSRFWFGQELPHFDLVAAMAVTSYRTHLHCYKVNVRAGRDLQLSRVQYSNFSFCE